METGNLRYKRAFRTKAAGVLHQGINASLTVETAAVLPVFLMGLLTLASVLLMYDFRMRMQASLLYAAQCLAVETADGHNIALSDVKDKIIDSVGGGDGNLRFVEGGEDGIDLSMSNLDNPEYVEVVAAYELVPVFDMFGLLGIPVCDRCVMHLWNGFENGYAEDSGEYVYITDNSEVYHLNRECSHIKLSIIETTGNEVSSLRNEDGKKYHSCEYCRAKRSDGVLYVTTDGDKFHNRISCPGLKRTVRAILIEDAKERGLRPCMRCKGD